MAEVENKPAAPAAPAPAEGAAVAQMPELPYGTRLYEVMWVVDANLARESMTKVMAGIKELVEKSGGAWVNGDKWEERRLAYPIKKKKRGMYILTHFTSANDVLGRLERNIQISDLVLRAMITRDEDGLTTTPPVRTIEDDDFGGGFGGGGGERRFNRDRGPRPSRD
ncbi:MAG: 30S ribosomal protein S6 [Planctomycetota bacterium]|nr:30S ribosomal protein S6 [Planctomycetota bacterium]